MLQISDMLRDKAVMHRAVACCFPSFYALQRSKPKSSHKWLLLWKSLIPQNFANYISCYSPPEMDLASFC